MSGNSTGWKPGSLTAVFVQFWKPVRAYRMMMSGRNTLGALLVTAVVIVLAGSVPLLLFSWDELELDWKAEMTSELTLEGYSPAAIDSMLTAELEEIRWRRSSIPFIGLAERLFYAFIGGLATLGAAYASGYKGNLWAHLKSSSLSQGAYVIAALFFATISMVLSAPPGFTWSAASLFNTSLVNPSRLYVFVYIFLSHLDLPSVISVTLWGLGLSALLERPSSFGLRMTWFVYICGILLISMPVLAAASGGV